MIYVRNPPLRFCCDDGTITPIRCHSGRSSLMREALLRTTEAANGLQTTLDVAAARPLSSTLQQTETTANYFVMTARQRELHPAGCDCTI